MRGKSLTKEQRDKLFKTYKRDGYEAAKALADEYQISRGHISGIARKAGYYKSPIVSQIMRNEARMWERAKAVGPVLAP